MSKNVIEINDTDIDLNNIVSSNNNINDTKKELNSPAPNIPNKDPFLIKLIKVKNKLIQMMYL